MKEERIHVSQIELPDDAKDFIAGVIADYLNESLMHSSGDITVKIDAQKCWVETNGVLQDKVWYFDVDRRRAEDEREKIKRSLHKVRTNSMNLFRRDIL